MRDAAGSAAASPLRATSKRADRSGGKRDASHAFGQKAESARRNVSAGIWRDARAVEEVRAEFGGGVWPTAGGGANRNHHLRGDARPVAVDGGATGINSRANSGRARFVSEMFRTRSARHLAAGMRLCPGDRAGLEGSEAALVHHRGARNSARRTASAVWNFCADSDREW